MKKYNKWTIKEKDKMKIILKEDVKSLGKKGEVVNVSPGYARNFILPKNLGVEATKKSLSELNLQKKAQEKQEKIILDEAKEVEKAINETTISLEIKAGEGGRTFGSVSTKEIAAAAMEQFKIEIDRKKIQLSEPIKNVGEYEVPVRLHPEVLAKLKINVKAV